MDHTHNIILYDANKQPTKCYRCGKRATAFINLSVTAASGTSQNMQAVCDEHNPYRLEVRVQLNVPEPDAHGYWTRRPDGGLHYHAYDPAIEDED